MPVAAESAVNKLQNRNYASVRNLTLLLSSSVYGIACLLPALVFAKQVQTETWTGLQCLVVGWLGLLVGNSAWLANFPYGAGLLLAVFRRWKSTCACSLLACLIGLDTLSLMGQELMADEGGVTTQHIQSIGPGFYTWMSSLAILGLGAICGMLWDRRAAFSQASNK